MAKAKTKAKKKPPKKPAKPKAPKKTKARPPRPVKEPKAVKHARQQPLRDADGKSIKGPEDKNLDELVNSAYDKSATFKKAQRDMNEARELAFQRMKKLGINVHETEDGVEARIKKTEEKLTLKREKKTVDLDEDDGEDSDGEGVVEDNGD